MARKKEVPPGEQLDHATVEASAETLAEMDGAAPSAQETATEQAPRAAQFNYAEEARDIVEGVTETCEFLLGPTWRAEPPELDRLARAAERVLAKYEVALGGWAPEVALGLAACAYAVPRMRQANAARAEAQRKAKAAKPAQLPLDQS